MNQKVVVVELTLKEAHLVKIIRQSAPFAEIIVSKQQGEPVRVKIGDSVILNEERGLEIGEVAELQNGKKEI